MYVYQIIQYIFEQDEKAGTYLARDAILWADSFSWGRVMISLDSEEFSVYALSVLLMVGQSWDSGGVVLVVSQFFPHS